jgi:hypothetical protein
MKAQYALAAEGAIVAKCEALRKTWLLRVAAAQYRAFEVFTPAITSVLGLDS